MYNTDDSIYGFAHASFKMAISKGMPMFMSTKKCIQSPNDEEELTSTQYNFKKIRRAIQGYLRRSLRVVRHCGWTFGRSLLTIYRTYKQEFEKQGLYYEHRLIGPSSGISMDFCY